MLRTRCVKRRAIKDVVWHQDKPGPHHIRRADPLARGIVNSIFITGMMMQGAFEPHDKIACCVSFDCAACESAATLRAADAYAACGGATKMTSPINSAIRAFTDRKRRNAPALLSNSPSWGGAYLNPSEIQNLRFVFLC